MKRAGLVAIGLLLAGCGSRAGLSAADPGTLSDGLGAVTTPDVVAPVASPTGDPLPQESVASAASPTSLPTPLLLAPSHTLGLVHEKGTVSVGLGYFTNVAAAAAGFGISGVSFGSGDTIAKLFVADINAHGGLGGRTLTPVWHAYDSLSTQSSAAQTSAGCADYTQDHHVLAVAGADPIDANFAACVTKTAVLVGGGFLVGSSDLAAAPSYVELDLSLDRSYRALPSALERGGYFSGKTKPVLGVIGFDDPSARRAIQQSLLPALSAAGHAVPATNIVAITHPSSVAGTAQVYSEVQAAVVKFKSQGVTHLINLDDGGLISLALGNDEDSQKYYPRWGVLTPTGLQTLVSSGNTKPEVAAGAVGLGWAPNEDLSLNDNPDSGRYSSPVRRHCLSVLATGGAAPSDANSRASALAQCDSLYLLKQVFDRLAGAPKVASFLQTLRGLGTLTLASLPEAGYTTAHHDVVTTGWAMRFEPACTCMRYVGSSVAIP